MNWGNRGVTDLTRGPIFQQLFWFSLPLLLGNLFQQLYSTADFLIVGLACGNISQAAVGASISLVHLLISATQGFAIGAGVLISHCFGAEETERARRAMHSAVVIGAALGIICMGIGFLFSRQILAWMQTPDDVLAEAADYFRIYSIGLFFMVMYNVGNGIFRALGNSRHPLYALITAVVINIVLDVLFIMGAGMGVKGAALATVFAQAASVVEELWVLFHTEERYRLKWKDMRIDTSVIGQMLKNAIPSSLQNSVVSLSNVLVQSYVNLFGSAAIAGFAAYNKLSGFAVLPAMSISLSLTTFVSQNMGARQLQRIRQGVWYGTIMLSTITAAASLLLLVFPHTLIGMFNPDTDVIGYGVAMARCAAPFLVLLGISHAMTGALRGLGQARVPMLVLAGTWCAMRVIWIWALIPIFYRIEVIYWGYPVTWVCSTALLYLCWRKLRPPEM